MSAGKQTPGVASDPPRPGFNGMLHEPVAHWQMPGNGYRAYSTTLMRYHSPDSLSPFGAGGLNSYVYCLDDPVNASDGDGHALKWTLSLVRTSARTNRLLGSSKVLSLKGESSLTGTLQLTRADIDSLKKLRAMTDIKRQEAKQRLEEIPRFTAGASGDVDVQERLRLAEKLQRRLAKVSEYDELLSALENQHNRITPQARAQVLRKTRNIDEYEAWAARTPVGKPRQTLKYKRD